MKFKKLILKHEKINKSREHLKTSPILKISKWKSTVNGKISKTRIILMCIKKLFRKNLKYITHICKRKEIIYILDMYYTNTLILM